VYERKQLPRAKLSGWRWLCILWKLLRRKNAMRMSALKKAQKRNNDLSKESCVTLWRWLYLKEYVSHFYGQWSTDNHCIITNIGMATIFTLCALFVLLIVMIAFCLGYRRKIRILRETLTTSKRHNSREGTRYPTVFTSTTLPTRRLYPTWIWTASNGIINTSYYSQTIEERQQPPLYSSELPGESAGVRALSTTVIV